METLILIAFVALFVIFLLLSYTDFGRVFSKHSIDASASRLANQLNRVTESGIDTEFKLDVDFPDSLDRIEYKNGELIFYAEGENGELGEDYSYSIKSPVIGEIPDNGVVIIEYIEDEQGGYLCVYPVEMRQECCIDFNCELSDRNCTVGVFLDNDCDGILDWYDEDDDNDGVPDDFDYNSTNPAVGNDGWEDEDSDENGIPDWYDPDGYDEENEDQDEDGITAQFDANDTDPDVGHEDENNNGIDDWQEIDIDDDGIPDWLDEDDDNDGVPDELDSHPQDDEVGSDTGWEYFDTDGDLLPDWYDNDDDGDGVIDEYDNDPLDNSVGNDNWNTINTDGDDLPDWYDIDDDNDGVIDEFDSNPLNDAYGSTDENQNNIPDWIEQDFDGDGLPDWLDNDDDNDNVLDDFDIDPYNSDVGADTGWEDFDSNGDSSPDYLNPDDYDQDGVQNEFDINPIDDTIGGSTGWETFDSEDDGIYDYEDEDDDNDTLSDEEDPHPQNDTVPSTYEPPTKTQSYNLYNCTRLTLPGTYVLRDNISFSGNCFNITSNDVVLNGNGKYLTGNNNGYAIYANGKSRITVKALTINSCSDAIYFIGVHDSFIINSNISSNINSAIYLESGTGNTLYENILISNFYGVLLNSSSNNILRDLTIKLNFKGIVLNKSSGSNKIINNNIYSNTNKEIYDVSTQQNFIVYENNNGVINWTHNDFLDDLSISGDLTFPGSIKIGNGFAYVNSVGISGNIDSHANIILKGNPGAGISDPVITKDGVHCPECYAFTPLDDSTVKFNVSGFSNYSLGELIDYPPVSLCGDNMSGFGNSSHPCLITNCSNLNSTRKRKTLRYKLNNNINCNVPPFNTGIGFEPIGNSTKTFRGVFDGNGKIITGLYINSTNSYVGLIGYAANATIRDVGLVNANIIGNGTVGGLVAMLSGSNAKVLRSYISGTVTSTTSGAYSTGGLVGTGNGIINNSYSTADVTGYYEVGGLAGGGSLNIDNSYATGNVQAGYDYVGGLLGKADGGSVKNSYATGNVTCSCSNKGGLIGISIGTITNSYWNNKTVGNPNSCQSNGNSGCTAIQDNEAYFQGDVDSISPTINWGFFGTWQETASSYPVLTWQGTGGSFTYCPSGMVGDNTINNPCMITTCEQLQQMNESLSNYYALANDIDCSDTSSWNWNADYGYYTGFEPIAFPKCGDLSCTTELQCVNTIGYCEWNFPPCDENQYECEVTCEANWLEGCSSIWGQDIFTGSFNGRGYTINNLYLKHAEYWGSYIDDLDYVGIFSKVDGTGYIGNFTLTNARSWGADYSSAIVGVNYGNHVIGDIIMNNVTHGLGWTNSGVAVGLNKGTIRNISIYDSSIMAYDNTGGLVGTNYGEISNAHFEGDILFNSGNVHMTNYGGLVGYNNGTITGSSAEGAIIGSQNIGGLVGRCVSGAVTESMANMSMQNAGVVGQMYNYGGLIGYSSCYVNNTYSISVKGGSYGSKLGGLVGLNDGGIIENSYSEGSMGGADIAGGLVGDNTGIITNSFTLTNTTISGSTRGGFAGTNTGSIINSYWNNHPGNPNDCYFNGNTGCTAIQSNPQYFKNDVFPSTSPTNQWDFFDTWSEKTNNYPVLTWQGNGESVCNPLVGLGTALDPYNISTCCQLQAMQNSLSSYYQLTQDIDCTYETQNPTGYLYNGGAGFAPIAPSFGTAFKGTFDGRNYTISGLYINRDTDYTALFGNTENPAIIKNVGLVDVNITGGVWNTGALIAQDFYWQPTSLGAKVENCYSTGIVEGTNNVGGLVGSYSGTMKNCYSTVNVTAGIRTGGLVGLNSGTIIDSYATGSVSGSDAGGLVGKNLQGIITSSFATGVVTGPGNKGGLVGYNQYQGGRVPTIEDSFYYNRSIDCVGVIEPTGDVTCTAVDNELHFKGDVYPDNAPMTNWTFHTIWQERTDDYPSLRWQNLGGDYDLILGMKTINESGAINGSVKVGDNLTINVSTTIDADSVWVVIWEGVVDTSTKIYEGFMNFIGDVWNIVIGTNESFQEGETNYTVYANDTSGYTENITGRFNVTCPVMPGLGTVGIPFSISSCCQLQHMNDNLTANYQLIQDVDCSGTVNWNDGAGFEPIGNQSTQFNGTFNGKNYTISDLFINRSSTDYIGLFGASVQSIITNIGLVNIKIIGNSGVGGLIGVGVGSGIVSKVYVTGTISGYDAVGSIVGMSDINISDSYSTANVDGNENIGGLMGYNWGSSIINCYSTGSVTGIDSVGGLTGYQYSHTVNTKIRIENSFASGNVNSINHTGGLFGFNNEVNMPTNGDITIINSYYNNHSGTSSNCSGGSIGTPSIDCKAIQDNEDYFQDDVYPLNAPMLSWDFFDTWSEKTNDYPVLTWQNIGGDICESLAGSGTALNPYQISKCCQLELMENDLSADYILTANVDCSDSINWDSGQGFTPVGRSSPYFTGTFDGKNYIISDVFINRTIGTAGLFGRADSGSEIRNVGVINISINGVGSYVGALVGYLKGATVDRTFSSGEIIATCSDVGGHLGFVYGTSTINNSYTDVDVTSLHQSCYTQGIIGGFSGRHYNTVNIYNSYATGDVTTSGQYAGGFIGMAYNGKTMNSFATGVVSGSIFSAGFGASANSGDFDNVYWYDQSSDEAYYCYTSFDNAPSDTNCIKINDVNGGLDYFKGDVYPNLDPMYYWDFTNVWEERANDYPSLKGFSLGGVVDDDPDLITDVSVYNKYRYQDEFNEIGTNVSFNVTTIIDTNNVWMTIWNTTIGGTSIWEGPLTNSTHRDWSVVIETNNTFPSANVNYTVYANNTLKENNRSELYFACPAIAGAGNSSDPYQINTCCQLHSLDYNRTAYYKLINDVDCSLTNPETVGWTSDGFWGHGRGFDPIAKGSSFSGQLDGNDYSIDGVYINTSEPIESMGLFATLASSGIISNLYLTNINMTLSNGIRNNYIGGLVGTNQGDIIGVSATGYIHVPSGYHVGCLVGSNAEGSLIDKAHTKCRVISYDDVGGIVGSNFNNGIIRNSYSESNVTGTYQVGGIAGYNYNAWVGKISRIENCYATGNITGRSDVGGLVGWNRNIINNSFAAANVTFTGSYHYKGGLVGDQDGTLENSHWYDDPNDDATSCFESGSGDCTEHALSYFKGDVYPSNEPMASWNFLTTWQEMGYDHPILAWISGEGTNLTTVSSCESYVNQSVILNGDVVFCGEDGRIWPIMLDHEVGPGKEAARAECSSFTHAGFNDWYLPHWDTLHAFGEDVCGWDPNCDGDCPVCSPADWDPNVAADPGVQWYWANDTYPGAPSWDLVMFEDGDFWWVGGGTVNVRCVRQICPGNMRGENTSASPCRITKCEQLQQMNRSLNSYYALANDIDCSDTSTWNGGAGFNPLDIFTGSFDGKNNTISDLYINRPGEDIVGLFGRTGSSASISNVGLINVNITGQDYVGGLVANNEGTINDVYTTGYVHTVFSASFDGSWVGGVAGINGGLINNSYSNADVDGEWKFCGGFVGYNGAWDGSGGITANSYATGNVICDTQDLGGFAGHNYGGGAKIINCFSTGNVSGGSMKGGFVGWNNGGVVTNSRYNNNSGNPNTCFGSGSPGGDCTLVNNNEAYFQGDVYPVNEPMASWTFYTIWQEKEDDYPIFPWQNTLPSVSSVILNATSTNNLSSDNLTGYVAASDIDGDSITYTYNWYKDGTLNATTLITNGLIAYYPLNNNTFDYYLSNDGINTGSTEVIGNLGNARYFDGSDYIQILNDDSLELSNQFTVSAWVKPEDTVTRADVGGDPIVQSEYLAKGFQIMWDYNGGNGRFGAMVSDGSTFNVLRGTADKQINKWYHVVGEYNGTTVKIYVDGEEENSYDYGFQPNNNLDIYIGVFNNGGFKERYLKATIDEVMIFNRSLDTSEVKMLYKGSRYNGIYMVSSETAIGDIWTLGVKAADITGWSDERNSTDLTIMSVYPGCDPSIGICTNNCNNPFMSVPPSMAWNYENAPPWNYCWENDFEQNIDEDPYCDSRSVSGSFYGDCAEYYDYAHSTYLCPSYARKGSAVTAASANTDCNCINFDGCPLAYSSIFNFSDSFFTG